MKSDSLSVNQIIEFIVCVIFAVTSVLLLITGDVGRAHFVLELLTSCSYLVFVINYFIKIPFAFYHQREGKTIPILWIVLPILTWVSIIFIDEKSILQTIIVVILYNAFFVVFYGRKRVMWVSLVILNVLPWLFGLFEDDLMLPASALYTYAFLTAVAIGYVELHLRLKKSKASDGIKPASPQPERAKKRNLIALTITEILVVLLVIIVLVAGIYRNRRWVEVYIDQYRMEQISITPHNDSISAYIESIDQANAGRGY